MSAPVAALRPLRSRRGVPWAGPAAEPDRWIRRRVGITWALLLLNVLTFYPKTWSGAPLAVPIPPLIGKVITQGALPSALIMALSTNRRIMIRPNVFLCLVSLLVLEGLMTIMQAQNLGTVYRTFRLTEFVATLWLLTPWWGRRDLLLIRCHLASTLLVLGSVLLGLLVAPGRALDQGRLAGTLWPTPPTQIAEFAAVAIGLIVILWLSGLVSGRATLLVVPIATAILLLTHTRTALIGLVVGVLVGGLSLFVVKARVRKLFAATVVVASVVALTLSGFVAAWLTRGQGTGQLTELTGRTLVWHEIVSIPRNTFQVIFGFGLSNKSFKGLPIDSNWLASYYDQGLVGVAICAAMLLFLLVTAYFQQRGVQRALALFLVSYCVVASLTETGFTDASTYLLYLTLAASMLVPPAADRTPA
jgi:hypothetical protein